MEISLHSSNSLPHQARIRYNRSIPRVLEFSKRKDKTSIKHTHRFRLHSPTSVECWDERHMSFPSLLRHFFHFLSCRIFALYLHQKPRSFFYLFTFLTRQNKFHGSLSLSPLRVKKNDALWRGR